MCAPNRLYGRFREPKMLHLAFVDQLSYRTGNVFDRNVRIDAMLIKEIDNVGPEPTQRRLSHLPDVLRAAILAHWFSVGIQFEAELGCDHNSGTRWRESFTHQIFVGEGAVGFRCIEKCHAQVDGFPNQRDSRLSIDSGSIASREFHASKTDGGNLKIASS